MNEKYIYRMKIWSIVTLFPIILGTMMIFGLWFNKSLYSFISGIVEYMIATYGFYHVLINWSLSKQKEQLW